jgi:hypothetical protein
MKILNIVNVTRVFIPLSTPATRSAQHNTCKEPAQSRRDLLQSPGASQLVTKFPTLRNLKVHYNVRDRLLLDSGWSQLNAEHFLPLNLQKILFNIMTGLRNVFGLLYFLEIEILYVAKFSPFQI